MKIHPLQAGRVLILLTNQEAGRLGLLNRELSEKQYRLICARLLREAFRYLHRAPFPGVAQARSVLLPGGEMLFWFLLPPPRRFRLKDRLHPLCCRFACVDDFLLFWPALLAFSREKARHCTEKTAPQAPARLCRAELFTLRGSWLLLLSLPMGCRPAWMRLCSEFACCRPISTLEAAWLREHGQLQLCRRL